MSKRVWHPYIALFAGYLKHCEFMWIKEIHTTYPERCCFLKAIQVDGPLRPLEVSVIEKLSSIHDDVGNVLDILHFHHLEVRPHLRIYHHEEEVYLLTASSDAASGLRKRIMMKLCPLCCWCWSRGF